MGIGGIWCTSWRDVSKEVWSEMAFPCACCAGVEGEEIGDLSLAATYVLGSAVNVVMMVAIIVSVENQRC